MSAITCCSRVQQWMIDHSAITVVGIGSVCVSGVFASQLIPYKVVQGALLGSLIHFGFSSCSLIRRPRSNIRLLVGSVISTAGSGVDALYNLHLGLASLSWFTGTLISYRIDQAVCQWLRSPPHQPIPQQEAEIVGVAIRLPISEERPVMGG